MSLWKKIFAKKKNGKKKAPSAVDTIDQLNKTLETLEMREKQLQKKVSDEAEKAKEYAKLKNKNAAIQCLKKKKLYEAQIEQLMNSQLRLHDQVMTLENAKATHDTIDVLKSGSSAVQALQQGLSVNEIEKVIGEDTEENYASIKEIQDLLANPDGISAEFNEDDFEAELEKLEGIVLEEELPEVSKSNSDSDVLSSESPAAPIHREEASQSIDNVDASPEIPATQPTRSAASLSIDNANELHASQPTRKKVSRSTSNVVENSSQLSETPARKTVTRSITNVDQHSETVNQSIATIDEFPEVPATPVTRNTGNTHELSGLRPAPVSRRTFRRSAA